MKKHIFTAVVIGIFVLVVVLVQFKQATHNSIKIGFVGPLTGFGASWGEETKAAIDVAVREINSRGGINGAEVKVIYEDGKCGSKDAVTAAEKLISIDQVRIIFTQCGQTSMAIAPIAERNKVLMMSLWSTPPKLSGIGQYVFRNSYSDDDTGRMLANLLDKKYTSVGMLSEVNDYSIGLRDAVKNYFHGDVIDETYFTGIKDARTIILKILSKNPQAVVVNPSSPADGLSLLKQLRQLGYRGPIYGNVVAASAEILQSEEAQGMIFFSDPDVSDTKLKKELFAQVESVVGHKPDFGFAVAVSYDSVYIMKKAIESVGLNPTKLKDYLHNLKDFSGVMGIYGFNDKGDATGYVLSAKQIKNFRVVHYSFENSN